MKYYLCVILLVFGVCGKENGENDIAASNAENIVEKVNNGDETDQIAASGNIETATNYLGDNNAGIGEKNDYNSYYGNRYFGRKIEDFLFDEKYIEEELYRTREHERFRFDKGNPDIHGKIQRPCQAYDTYCIRKFFAEHSHCKISERAVPDPIFRAQTTFNVPGVNVSATLLNAEYRGIKDGRVSEFYIDKVSDNLVMALDFDNVTFFSNNVNVKYYHRGREPTVLRDFSSATFLKSTVTLVIPNLKDLQLDRAEISTYAGEPLPPVVIGPGIGSATDPEVVLMYAAILANLRQEGQETLLTEGNFFAITFIQYNICDFGLKGL